MGTYSNVGQCFHHVDSVLGVQQAVRQNVQLACGPFGSVSTSSGSRMQPRKAPNPREALAIGIENQSRASGVLHNLPDSFMCCRCSLLIRLMLVYGKDVEPDGILRCVATLEAREKLCERAVPGMQDCVLW